MRVSELANDSIKKDNQPPNEEDMSLGKSTKYPLEKPKLNHTAADKKYVKQLRQRIYSSKSSIVYLNEEDIRLLASFDELYARGLRSYAQSLLRQLTMGRTNINDKTRQDELVDSLKKAIEEENWKPVKKDSTSIEERKK